MSRKPDYRLKVKDKTTDKSNIIGSAWKNPGGSISIQLNVCTVIEHDPDLLITLFPNDRPESESDQEDPPY